MSCGVPGDVFFDTGTGYPVAKSFQTHGVARKQEDNLITIAVFWLANESQKTIVERYDDSIGYAMRLGFALLELQQLV